MSTITARQTAMLVMAFVVTCILLLLLDQQNRLDPVKAPLEKALQPFSILFDRTGRRIGSIGDGSPSELERQLEAVTAERDQLLAENARLRQLEDEVVQLQKQLEFRAARPELTVVSATVLGRDPNSVQQILVIDRGTNDGVQKGMAVISPDFLVGRVTEVSAERARVTLAVDASSRIGAMLQDSGADGVLYGQTQSGGWPELRHLPPTTEVQVGEVVVTSGRSALVPQGLVIGRVSRVDRNPQADTLTVEVYPLVDGETLQSVAVILSDSRSSQ